MREARLPFYYKEYIASTVRFSALEHGACFLLLIHFWQNDGLPQSDVDLAKIARLSVSEWKGIRDDVMEFFTREVWRSGKTAAQRSLGVGMKEQRPAIPKDVRIAVIERDGFVCVYCGDDDGPFDLDHKLPWVRGGKHTVENLVVACQHCNRSKGALTVEEWRQ